MSEITQLFGPVAGCAAKKLSETDQRIYLAHDVTWLSRVDSEHNLNLTNEQRDDAIGEALRRYDDHWHPSVDSLADAQGPYAHADRALWSLFNLQGPSRLLERFSSLNNQEKFTVLCHASLIRKHYGSFLRNPQIEFNQILKAVTDTASLIRGTSPSDIMAARLASMEGLGTAGVSDYKAAFQLLSPEEQLNLLRRYGSEDVPSFFLNPCEPIKRIHDESRTSNSKDATFARKWLRWLAGPVEEVQIPALDPALSDVKFYRHLGPMTTTGSYPLYRDPEAAQQFFKEMHDRYPLERIKAQEKAFEHPLEEFAHKLCQRVARPFDEPRSNAIARYLLCLSQVAMFIDCKDAVEHTPQQDEKASFEWLAGHVKDKLDEYKESPGEQRLNSYIERLTEEFQASTSDVISVLEKPYWFRRIYAEETELSPLLQYAVSQCRGLAHHQNNELDQITHLYHRRLDALLEFLDTRIQLPRTASGAPPEVLDTIASTINQAVLEKVQSSETSLYRPYVERILKDFQRASAKMRDFYSGDYASGKVKQEALPPRPERSTHYVARAERLMQEAINLAETIAMVRLSSADCKIGFREIVNPLRTIRREIDEAISDIPPAEGCESFLRGAGEKYSLRDAVKRATEAREAFFELGGVSPKLDGCVNTVCEMAEMLAQQAMEGWKGPPESILFPSLAPTKVGKAMYDAIPRLTEEADPSDELIQELCDFLNEYRTLPDDIRNSFYGSLSFEMTPDNLKGLINKNSRLLILRNPSEVVTGFALMQDESNTGEMEPLAKEQLWHLGSQVYLYFIATDRNSEGGKAYQRIYEALELRALRARALFGYVQTSNKRGLVVHGAKGMIVQGAAHIVRPPGLAVAPTSAAFAWETLGTDITSPTEFISLVYPLSDDLHSLAQGITPQGKVRLIIANMIANKTLPGIFAPSSETASYRAKIAAEQGARFKREKKELLDWFKLRDCIQILHFLTTNTEERGEFVDCLRRCLLPSFEVNPAFAGILEETPTIDVHQAEVLRLYVLRNFGGL